MPNTIKNLIAWGASNLEENKFMEARILLAFVLGFSQEQLLIEQGFEVPESKIQEFQKLITRRQKKEPIAYIIGKKEFWGREFNVAPGVLIPRPDSEILIESAFTLFPTKTQELKITDFGTGSGCLIITLLYEYPNAQGVAFDISKTAINIAQSNATELEDRIRFVNSSWNESRDELKNTDLLISNPPYIESKTIKLLQKDVKNYEPLLALDGGEDGYNPYREIAELAQYLPKTAKILLEIGQHQEKKIKEIFAKKGLKLLLENKDLAGIVRVLGFSFL